MPDLRQLRAAPPRASGVAGAALVLFLGCARSSTELGPNAAAPADPLATGSPSDALDSRTQGWVVGKGYPYRLKLSTTIAVDQGPNQFDFDLTGQALVVPVRVTTEKATLYLSVADARITSRIAEGQPELDRAAEDVRKAGIFFALSGGRTSEFHLPKGQSQLAGNTYRAIASALQFARPRAPASKYTSEEYDTTGQALTEYERGEAAGTWHKRKVSYLATLGIAGAFEKSRVPVVPEIVSSGSVRLAPSGRPENVTQSDDLSVRGAQAPIRSKVTLELAGAPEETVVPPAGGWEVRLAEATRVTPDQPIGDAAPIERLDAARIGSLDFEKVLAELERIEKKKAAEREANEDQKKKDLDPAAEEAEEERRQGQLQTDSQLFFALAALFRTDARTISKALAKIRANSPAALVLIDGLSSAGSPEAQKALVALMDQKHLEPKLKTRAINALVQTPKPSEVSIRALRSLLESNPFDMRAIYGLGTYSRSLRDDGKTAQAGELGELLVERLRLARRSGELVTVLRGIANSGYGGALSSVTPYLKDKRENVRSAAVRALQSMRDPRVDSLLAARLAEDESSLVRLAALKSIQLREPNQEILDALITAATVPADSKVRFRAVDLMIRWLPERPVLHAALQQVANSDSEEQVRNRAKAAL
jgi:hypothetical protein